MKDCYVWLYRGAWNEWKVYDIEMAVPLSPEQVLKKRRAIFKHQSQKDGAVFPGDDVREYSFTNRDRAVSMRSVLVSHLAQKMQLETKKKVI